jgi:ABC-2 type transport system permease protein
MFGPLFAFELRGHFRRPTTWLYVAIMFFLAFFALSTEAVLTGAAMGKVKKNSPYALAQMYAIMLAIGQIITRPPCWPCSSCLRHCRWEPS